MVVKDYMPEAGRVAPIIGRERRRPVTHANVRNPPPFCDLRNARARLRTFRPAELPLVGQGQVAKLDP